MFDIVRPGSGKLMNRTVKDYSTDGACSGCGGCCTDFLPMNGAEVQRIKKYIQKHRIKARTVAYAPMLDTLDLTCPFRNEAEKRCEIYDARPAICREFLCSRPKAEVEQLRERFDRERTIYSCREVFFGDAGNAEYLMAVILMNATRMAGGIC